MSQKFSFQGLAEIVHLNTRKEGPEDSKELAVDVKLLVAADAAILDMLGDGLGPLLFTEAGVVRNTHMGPVTFTHELEHYRLETMGAVHHGCRVKKFSVEPKDGNLVALTFGVSFKPSGVEVAKMAEYLQDAIEIRLEPSNEELDLGGTETGAQSTAEDGQNDPLYGEAVALVVKGNRPSISFVQRHLQIGYNRAARLIESMERAGVVSPMDAQGGRTVLQKAA